jgi:hypothetical protein
MTQHQMEVILNFWGPIPILLVFAALIGLLAYEIWLFIWQKRA